MKFLIVGCGSIGKRHLRNLRALGYQDLLVLRHQPGNVEEIEKEFGAVSFVDLKTALSQKPDIAIIANPTALHLPIALAAANACVNLFIEKPISHNLFQLDELSNMVARSNLVVSVAYNLRFHKGLKMVRDVLQAGTIGRPLYIRAEVGSYLPDWRPGRDYRHTYSAHEDQGGGALLDLSHEIDYLLWLFGPVRYISAQIGQISDLEINVEDTADLLMEHKNGIYTSLHVDYFQRYATRKCKLVGTQGTLILDFLTNRIEVFQVNNSWEILEFDQDLNSMYVDELKNFIACVECQQNPLVSLADGIEVLRVALAAKMAAITGKRQEIADVF